MNKYKHWFIETYAIGPKNERWMQCPYCGEKKQIKIPEPKKK